MLCLQWSLLCVHSAEDEAQVNLLEMFPGLFDCVYLFVKVQGWKTRPTMKEFYETSSLEGAMSNLSIKSP